MGPSFHHKGTQVRLPLQIRTGIRLSWVPGYYSTRVVPEKGAEKKLAIGYDRARSYSIRRLCLHGYGYFLSKYHH